MSIDWGSSSVTRKLSKPRYGTVAVLDIGTSKVCCLIARAERPSSDGTNAIAAQPRVIGAGHQISRGVRNGTIVNVDATEDAVRKAVHMAEQIAQENINVRVHIAADCFCEAVDAAKTIGNHREETNSNDNSGARRNRDKCNNSDINGSRNTNAIAIARALALVLVHIPALEIAIILVLFRRLPVLQTRLL